MLNPRGNMGYSLFVTFNCAQGVLCSNHAKFLFGKFCCLPNSIVCQQSGDLFRDLMLRGIGMLLVVNTVLI